MSNEGRAGKEMCFPRGGRKEVVERIRCRLQGGEVGSTHEKIYCRCARCLRWQGTKSANHGRRLADVIGNEPIELDVGTRLRHHVRLNLKNGSLHRLLITCGQKEHSVQLLVQEQALQLAQDSLDFQHYFVECCTHVTTIA